MKKRAIRNLTFNKNTISKFDYLHKVKGGNRSNTSCLCMDTVCECDQEAPLRGNN